MSLLRGQVAFAAGTFGEAPALLLQAARQLEPLDGALARQTYLEAWTAALFAGRFAQDGNLHEVSRAARSAPPPPDPPAPHDLLLDGLAVLGTDGGLRKQDAVAAIAFDQIGGKDTRHRYDC